MNKCRLLSKFAPLRTTCCIIANIFPFHPFVQVAGLLTWRLLMWRSRYWQHRQQQGVVGHGPQHMGILGKCGLGVAGHHIVDH